MKKINNKLRDLLLEQTQTLLLSQTKATYYNEIYTFNRLTKKELLDKIEDVASYLRITAGRGVTPVMDDNSSPPIDSF